MWIQNHNNCENYNTVKTFTHWDVDFFVFDMRYNLHELYIRACTYKNDNTGNVNGQLKNEIKAKGALKNSKL